MRLTVSIPTTTLSRLLPDWQSRKHSDADVRQGVVDLLKSALDLGLAPYTEAVPGGQAVRATVWIPEQVRPQFLELLHTTSLTPARLARDLLQALDRTGGYTPPPPASDHPIVKIHLALKRMRLASDLREEQVAIYDDLDDALRSQVIGLVEAGTGVGKTRAEIAAAAAWVKREKLSVCLAVPTLALLRQAIEEHARQATIDADIPPLRPVRGRQEFVHTHALTTFLEEADDEALPPAQRKALDKWVKDGGRCDEYSIPWTVEELRRVGENGNPEARALPIDDLRLPDLLIEEGRPDPGYISYRAQFERRAKGEPREIILCSHAMLAQDVRQRMRRVRRDEDYLELSREISIMLRHLGKARKPGTADGEEAQELKTLLAERGLVVSGLGETRDTGILPPYHALIVDEAQQLETTFSRSLSDYVSLHELMREISRYKEAGGRVHGHVMEEGHKLLVELSHLGEAGEFASLAPGEDAAGYAAIMRRFLLLIGEVPMPRKGADPQRLIHATLIARDRALIKRALDTRRGYLSFSPQRAYPQLYLGPRSVETYLGTLWELVRAGAAVSATLYTYQGGGYSANYQRMLLGIPAQKAREYAPVHVRWTRDPVTVYTPDTANTAKLLPPHGVSPRKDDETRWHHEVAGLLRRVHSTSAGGVLVLLTSYRTVNLLAELLADLDLAMVRALPSSPVRSQIAAFHRRSKDGIKPLWLAVGAAWTGIDVGGHSDSWKSMFGNVVPAEEDNVLTDLVIPRLPYHLNQSITYRWRLKNRPEFPWATLEAGFVFMQGLGRLIRRPGLPSNRRIFVTDARLVEPMANTTRALFWNALLRYPYRKLIEF